MTLLSLLYSSTIYFGTITTLPFISPFLSISATLFISERRNSCMLCDILPCFARVHEQ
jgi:hypothetical protein